jgi:hypothetical protein
MSKGTRHTLVLVVLSIAGASALGAQGNNPFVGRWALTIPGGGAGWLGVTQENGFLDASILWGGGSVLPVDCVFLERGDLYVVRLSKVERRDATGKVIERRRFRRLSRPSLKAIASS